MLRTDEAWAAVPAGRLDRTVQPEQAAAVIYTSGSTGRPKGVVVPHRALTGIGAAWERAHGGGGLRWLSVTSASFDVFTGDVVRSLCSGGALVLADVGLQLSVPEWAETLTAYDVNAFECAPRYADQLVEHLAEAGAQPAGLRLLVATTDVWRRESAVRARAVLGPQVRVLTAYGVTEATIDSTYGE